MATTGCAQDKYVAIDGGFDDAFVAQIQSQAEAARPITLSSYGGDPAVAYAAVPLLDNYPTDIAIGSLCLSSCAEFALPTKARLNLIDRPLIGFHGSDQIARWLSTEIGLVAPICGAARADFQRARFESLGWNPDFWKEVAKRLMIVSGRNDNEEGRCLSIISRAEITMWFPTSAQLASLLGFTPDAPLCADDEVCWRSRVQGIISPGQRFVVGDAIFLMSPEREGEPLRRDQFQGAYLLP